MANKRKSVDIESIRVYLDVMRRLLLNNMTWLFAAAFAAATPLMAAGRTAYLVVLNDGTALTDVAPDLARSGWKIRQAAPPSVLIADFPADRQPVADAAIKAI